VERKIVRFHQLLLLVCGRTCHLKHQMMFGLVDRGLRWICQVTLVLVGREDCSCLAIGLRLWHLMSAQDTLVVEQRIL
jgi:hypothetical protein